LIASLGCAASTAASERVLRVCADPNNLPFSNQQGEGFENRIAELLAKDLDARLEYTWWAQRRGFVRNTLRAGECDLLMGAPNGYELALTTRPYYRSSYIFVYRSADALRPTSLDDPVLRKVRLGVQMIGADFANTPPASALSKRGILDNVVGYTVYGDYAQDSPAARIVAAVAKGEVDIALVWGPFAGYFAPRAPVPLALAAIGAESDGPGIPFVFDICLAVRKGDTAFRDELDAFIERHRRDIDVILASYGVPVLPLRSGTPPP
jgi:mxaJ protein